MLVGLVETKILTFVPSWNVQSLKKITQKKEGKNAQESFATLTNKILFEEQK